ncbi:hypothetical protein QTI24_25410 [Variovorax sp. J22P240]|uniref:bestrophin-like domain n=1 Tax=Variovorax sp. J22P240 TaxID=3053514 RepID=UPI0025775704|nr:hypothetical protein [Variovorax sp. J22P240]MDM0001968.1 hypothetical protein [Variovorax sp. J22P240]
MLSVTDYPLAVFGLSFLLLLISVWTGALLFRRWWPPKDSIRDDFGVIQTATLTLLGLIIAFSFSMAVSRYDQRKSLEEAEANAIATEFLRADLLPGSDAAKVRALLADYFDQRLLYYTTRDEQELKKINVRTAQLQAALWSAVAAPAAAAPSPTMALVAMGMNDVLNAQGYTQAAWWNRIPSAAWILMLTIGIFCHVLVGYGVKDPKEERALLLVLPLVMSIAFMLIADIDSPRSGAILVQPVNLLSVAELVRPR